MELNDYDLRQLNDEVISSLSSNAVKNLASQLLHDLKISRERLNQNSQNSSVPPSSEAPWDKASAHNNDDEIDNHSEIDEPITEEDTLKAALQADADASNDTVSDEEDLTPASDNIPEIAAPESSRKAGKQPGAQGFGRTQKIPIHHHQSHYPTQCACCGQSFNPATHFIAYTAFDSLDIGWGNLEQPGIKVENTRHTYHKTECSCGHITRESPMRLPPDSELPGIELGEWRLVGASLACLIVCLSKRMRLSRARIREFLDDWLGLTISVGTINNAIHEAGRAALPVEDMLEKEVLKSELLNIDETSWKQKKELLWLWVFVSTTVVLFKISKRTSTVFKELIIDHCYPGWVMSDGYRVYRQHGKRLRCWAHLIRKARGLEEALNNEARDFGEKTLELLNQLIDAIKAARESPPDKALSAVFKQQLDEYKLLCEKMRGCEHKKTHALAVEMLNDWAVIFTILDHPHLPLTNNEAERALRHWVILRKISYGTKTAEGSRVFAILASVIETCRIREVSPWRYLADVISNRRAGLPAPPLPVSVLGCE